MITGRGMIARALHSANGVNLYAAGVSNPTCVDPSEFNRDRDRLAKALERPEMMVYFSSCAVAGQETPYRKHKLHLEHMVRERGNYLICRLPTVAGTTPNPHTLLNYLYVRIARGEKVDVWMKARRNVIDILDVSAIVRWLIRGGAQDETINIASPVDYAVPDIVKTMEQVLHLKAVIGEVQGGDSYTIDTSRIKDAPVARTGSYLEDVMWKYYA